MKISLPLLTILITVLISSCTIIPNTYVHYEGKRLSKKETAIITTSSFSSKKKLEVLERFSKEINKDELVISRISDLSEIDGKPYKPYRFDAFDYFDSSFTAEIPSGKTKLRIDNHITTFDAKAGHKYVLFQILADGKSYTSNYTATTYTKTTTWTRYTLIYDKTDNELFAATQNGGVKHVK